MALSPLDGRYAEKTQNLRNFFSEFALMRYRVFVEIRWLQQMQPQLSAAAKKKLEDFFVHFNESDAAHIKTIEKTTNHDVKAVEYFVKEKLQTHPELALLSEWVHFACTSEDINNLSYALMLKAARAEILMPLIDTLVGRLRDFAHQYAAQPLLARTHGQPATPTTVGKEFANVVARLQPQKDALATIKIRGKMNGAVGNFNAHYIAFPDKNWPGIAADFVENLGLSYAAYTTQIEPHDYLAEFAQNLIRINTILIDFCRDTWAYISLGYFQQQVIANEVGSSTMPHKVNPINFENAEGNFIMANAILACLAERLPVSRWQRDLVDSTLLRNVGVGVGHAVIGYQSLRNGLQKIQVNPEAIMADLSEAWEVLAEPVQTVMRAHGIENSYEQLKILTRGKRGIDQMALHQMIDGSDLPEKAKEKLKALRPETYLGSAVELAKQI